MPDTDGGFAFTVAERLRQSIESAPIKISRAPNALTITVSIGIASSTGGDDVPDQLLRRADQALYRAKREGPTGSLLKPLKSALKIISDCAETSFVATRAYSRHFSGSASPHSFRSDPPRCFRSSLASGEVATNV